MSLVRGARFNPGQYWVDLYCCEGGASMGYHRALGDRLWVSGVDIFEDYSSKRYPFPYYVGDVISFLAGLLCDSMYSIGGRWIGLRDIAGFSASPPCNRYSITNHNDRDYPDLVAATRELLIETGKPYVIENVLGAPLKDPVELCGCMFDLTATDTDGIRLHMWRPRQFESNVEIPQPVRGQLRLPRSTIICHNTLFHDYEWVGGSYGGARRDKYEAKYVRKGGYVPSIGVQQRLLGIDWMTQKGMHQSIPPVYTEYVGKHLLAALS